MQPRDALALACDYDRTLTDEDAHALVPDAVAALAEARRQGLRVIVVSGRGVAFLESALGSVADAIVAENGALLKLRGEPARETAVATGSLRAVLDPLGIEVEYGDVLASIDVEHETLARDALLRAGHDRALVRNRDRVMLLPPGVDKALGVRHACEALGIPAERAAAVGDAENDVAMLLAVGYGIAVANALPEVIAAAKHVTARPGGHGVAEWIREAWLAKEARS